VPQRAVVEGSLLVIGVSPGRPPGAVRSAEPADVGRWLSSIGGGTRCLAVVEGAVGSRRPRELGGLVQGARRRGFTVICGSSNLLARDRTLVRRSEVGGPLLLVLDDLQWADRASVAAVDHVARYCGRIPVGIVATLRPGTPRPDLSHLRRVARSHGGVDLPLGQLADDAVLELVVSTAGGQPGDWLRQYARRAGGGTADACSPRELAHRQVAGWETLTRAESRVAGLAARGLTNPEIGHLLTASPRTVESHLSHVFGKLGISSRVELAAAHARRWL
jgi:DNA-binding CsgD family transcriptional regulator